MEKKEHALYQVGVLTYFITTEYYHIEDENNNLNNCVNNIQNYDHLKPHHVTLRQIKLHNIT